MTTAAFIEKHKTQIHSRSLRREAAMFGLCAYMQSPAVSHLEFTHDMMPIGTMTHFVMSRQWRNQPNALVALKLVGYKARVSSDGRIVIGGRAGEVCAYDFKYTPFRKTRWGSVILSADKRTTFDLGLRMDQAIIDVVDNTRWPHARIETPAYMAGYSPRRRPDVEDTAYTRQLVLDYLRPSTDMKAPACCLSPGGVIDEIVRAPEVNRTFISWGPEAGMAQELPARAVLRPWVREKAEIEAGTVIADMVPRGVYTSWEALGRYVTSKTRQWLLKEVVAAQDVEYQGLILRDVRACPSQLLAAKQVFEKVDVAIGSPVCPQVVVEITEGRSSLRFSEGPIDVDLLDMSPGWSRKFQ